ncbi:MAG: PilN domain-containing protein [Gammaproteobacteria bacterium]|nr:PilN domain-containing protein [Gammaproteobacteria bacterium]MCP4089945.1 PilN domain-containing protein [Gammaproteobacteria bacterium]MCP4276276.1 PilN domain-containing protein [Gammaproteobacteria bacterium]MCP4831271.1 PilN domain-containing protein [Gammaproteobacteria bacterium]MCP4928754.1 PilN domain-containing protein [Gammaproteobacteria bacterium]
MPKINLLPWRDELRTQRRNQFYMAMGGAFLFASVVVLIGVFLMNGIIDSQQDRNKFIEQEIVMLDKRIKEILDLEDKKDRLVARMKIIEQLQQSRPGVVHLLEDIARSVPDGVYLSSVKQNGDKLEIKGAAESNTRVSAFMRNIDKSHWLESPDLKVVEVKSDSSKGLRASEFTVNAKQVRVQLTEEDS